MKKFLFIFVCCLLMNQWCNAKTEDVKSDEKASYTLRLNEKKGESHDNRPNMPSRWCITCTYSIGNLSFILPENVDGLQVTLGSEMFPVWVGFVNKSCPSVTIPEFTGEVEITCEDNLGRKYYGILYFGQD